ncbi:DegT/DnrJ/EryC1/StrS family aminotransferase [Pseudothermotoga sp.]|uniref:DegT/DnrJ/EryC1/StrS family aminotransferase n=1 Tax=Pseudothermotoga sp. TaxID=2033661 RepID=UPI0031F64362
MRVPLFDMTRQYESLRDEILTAVDSVFKSGRLIMGENVEKFEEEIANYLGVKHAIGVANGSDALYIAVKSLGITHGDYVITTPFTFFATVSCITRNNATPIFVDIDEDTFNVDLDQIEHVLRTHPYREKIKAIIPVHLFGRTVDLERLEYIKHTYRVKIIEDCAQSVGSTWHFSNGEIKKSGSVGDVSILSFFPTKNLGAHGDGGMILTSDDRIADFCRIFRVHGARVKYFHEVEGINSRLDEVQAAILRVKLKKLDEYHRRRREIARLYNELFEKFGLTQHIVCPPLGRSLDCIFHQYVVRVKKGHRDNLKLYLESKGVETAIYYPLGMHRQKCFSYLPSVELEKTDRACKEVLALPMFPELREEEIEYVVGCVRDYFREVCLC